MRNDLAKDSDIKLVRSDLQFIKEELIRQKKDIDAEQSNIQLRAEIEQQKQNILDREANILILKAELEKLKQSVLDKESENQLLKMEQENQKRLIDGLHKELDKHDSLYFLYNCFEAKSSGTYDIILPNFRQPFKVACDAETQEGGWTVIMRRIDGSVNFYRNWTEYKTGFGDLDGEFFMGLDKIHAMTAHRKQELLVLLEDFEGDKRFEKYEEFAIGDEDQEYVLHTLGNATGTAGDSLSYHRGMKFTTFDRDNDLWLDGNCAERGTGAWWYNYCQRSQLTGKYKDTGKDKGITWDSFRGFKYSLKTAVMMIRPKK
ncbi:microfibril-associated glycoprotein 4-like [Drosophila innubila]|uniref:microfibril-associated glycoprotein 4-like n=1 Tax=Drosophila innubila TaxID=198719 RepID=UPI00148B8EE5|nr:microfibril-associated glycoprotein 4-like [Drosophila innubila]